MAAFNFPSSPTNGDTYTLNSVTYQYDGTKWIRYSASVGAQGNTGSTGAQGSQGTQGHQGLQGAQAHISTSAPSSGVNNGDLWWDSDGGDLSIYYNDGNSSQWVDINTGPRGAQGGTGPTGAQGNTGATGAQGAAGSGGSTGAQGTTGATGAQGATGSTGAQGAQGHQGATGAGGATGAQGATGSTGAQGALATINNNTDNYVITGSGTANTLNAESTLRYDASLLNIISTTQGLGLRLQNTGNEYTSVRFDAARTAASSALGILEGRWNNQHNVCQIYLQSGDDTTNKDDGRISMVVHSSASQNKTALRIEPNASVQLPNDSQKLQFGNDQDLNIWHGGSNGYIDNETGDLSIRTTSSNTERLRITSGGDLGLGVNPARHFHLHVNSSAANYQLFTNSTTGSNNNDGLLVGITANEEALFWNYEATDLRLATSGVERIRIASGGQVIIGDDDTGKANGHFDDLIVGANASTTETHGITIVCGNAATNGGIAFSDGSNGGADAYRGMISYQHNDNHMQFRTNANERLRIDSDGRFLIGGTSSSSPAKLAVSGSVNNAEAFLELNRTNDPANGQNIGVIEFCQGNSASRLAARIMARRDGSVWGASSLPSRLQFHTCSSGSSSTVERLRIDSGGCSFFSRTGYFTPLDQTAAVQILTPTNGGDCGLFVHGASQQGGTSSPHACIRIHAHNCANDASEQLAIEAETIQQLISRTTGIKSKVNASYNATFCYFGELNKNVGAYTDGFTFYSKIVQTNSGGSSYHMRCEDNGSIRLNIFKNGNIQNTNNSYGQISDVKHKENIVDASSQWDDIKNIKVRKFNFKESSGFETHTQIGVVAQELETISPGLIDTENDIEIDEETGKGTVTGTTKSVKYSILYMKAIKALQEAMTRIETLEAKVNTLEGS